MPILAEAPSSAGVLVAAQDEQILWPELAAGRVRHSPALPSSARETETEVDEIPRQTRVKKLLFPRKELLVETKASESPCRGAHFTLAQYRNEHKKKPQLGGGCGGEVDLPHFSKS